MPINQKNIVPFIAQLYLEKKGQKAPDELLNSWSQLSDEDINRNLSGLFESWGMNENDKQRMVNTFLAQGIAAQQPPIPPHQSQQNYNNPQRTSFTNTTPVPNHTQHQSQPAPKRISKTTKKRSLLSLVIILPLALIVAFVAYKYVSYNTLSRVYAITQNIAVRDEEGKMVGRMDLYADSAIGSYSSLRALDNTIYYVQPEGSNKEYPSRKVIVDSISFKDYLFNKNYEAYVNVNYLVDDKKEYNLYANAFKEVQEFDKDNTQLKAPVRKVIVGSMAATQDMEDKYIVTNTEGLNKNMINITNSLIIQSLQNDQEYVVIAGLNDGRFYRFEGNVSKNIYKPLTEIALVDEFMNTEPIQGKYRFTQSDGVWKLYNTQEKSSTHYQLMKDDNGKNAFFQYNPPKKIVTQDTPFDTVANGIKNIVDEIKSILPSN